MSEQPLSYAKISIDGLLVVKTGLHIGTGGGFSAIGGTDSPVIRDPLTRLPVIPGTTLKGKMRSLLARQLGTDKGEVYASPGKDHARIRRLFGDTEEYMTGRLIFRDAVLSNAKELQERGAKTFTEIKFENTINRISAVAMPRQSERVLPGSEFPLQLIYEVTQDLKTGTPPSLAVVREDIQLIVTGFRLVAADYLGGSGTRGYGRVEFRGLSASCVVGKAPDDLLKELGDALETV